MILMVRLKLRVGPKGQILLPKIVRDKLGIKPRSTVTVDLQEDQVILQRGLNVEELLNWLEKTRKPIAELVSKIGLEDEALEAFP
ncbi:MAG: AbrB/MazE/SpoVT family DNA-binding domain-containing protein [Candidatus Brockarchaeota archaeon]|nr:AbrB/MazE/SpoVT family DNA-binding domain-containing protein [Candidatus Brockarchaeota archaeon]